MYGVCPPAPASCVMACGPRSGRLPAFTRSSRSSGTFFGSYSQESRGVPEHVRRIPARGRGVGLLPRIRVRLEVGLDLFFGLFSPKRPMVLLMLWARPRRPTTHNGPSPSVPEPRDTRRGGPRGTSMIRTGMADRSRHGPDDGLARRGSGAGRKPAGRHRVADRPNNAAPAPAAAAEGHGWMNARKAEPRDGGGSGTPARTTKPPGSRFVSRAALIRWAILGSNQ